MANGDHYDYSKIRDQGQALIGFDFIEDDFKTILSVCSDFTLTSKERMYALHSATKYIVGAGIIGDFVECGVWQGGSCMNMALTLQQQGDCDRTIFLFDTYEGMTEPEDIDIDLLGRTAQQLLESPTDSKPTKCTVDLPTVQKNLGSTGYPIEKLQFVKGDVLETIPEKAPQQIALLRLDTDWYASTKHELEHLYPLLSPGGILIIDDYGHWRGSKIATDEYFENVGPVYMNRIDYTGRLIVKR